MLLEVSLRGETQLGIIGKEGTQQISKKISHFGRRWTGWARLVGMVQFLKKRFIHDH
jgi:hypothetical protein